MTVTAVQACLGLLALTCGQVLFWHRRDNVLGYLQGGLFITTLLIPLLGTPIFDEFDSEVTQLYANLIAVGGAAYLVGLYFGSPWETPRPRKPGSPSSSRGCRESCSGWWLFDRGPCRSWVAWRWAPDS